MIDGSDTVPPSQAPHTESPDVEPSSAVAGSLKQDGEEDTGKQGDGTTGCEPGTADLPLEEEDMLSSNARPLVWVKKDVLCNLLHEELSETQVRCAQCW